MPTRLVNSWRALIALVLLALLIPSAGVSRAALTGPQQTGQSDVTGTVSLAGVGPTQNAFVTLFPLNGGSRDYANARYEYTDFYGNFTFIDLPAGSYLLEIDPPYGEAAFEPIVSASFTLSGAPGTVTQGPFTLARALKRLTGTVKLPNGQTPPRAYIYAYTTQAPYASRTDVIDTTDAITSNDSFDIGVTPGEWVIYPDPPYREGWMYTGAYTSVSIPNDSTSQVRSLNFAITPTNGTIAGRLVGPGGAPITDPCCPYNYNAYVSLSGENGLGSRFEPIDPDGTFEIPVAPGRYNVAISLYDTLAQYTAPNGLVAEVTSGTTLLGGGDGTITLAAKSARVRGTVTAAGAGVADAIVFAYSDSDDYASTRTNSSGAYTLALTPGAWTVDVYIDEDRGFTYLSPPVDLTLGATSDEQVPFLLAAADYQISGSTVVQKNGTTLPTSGARGWAYARNAAGEYVAWDDLENEAFTLNVPRGTYTVGLDLAPGNKYTLQRTSTVTLSQLAGADLAGLSGAAMEALERSPYEVTVTVGDGPGAEATSVPVALTLVENNAVLTGRLLGANGAPLTGVAGQVFATPADGESDVWQVANVNPADGSYRLSLAGGSWYLGYYLFGDTGIYDDSPNALITVDAPAGTTSTYDIALTALDGVLRGRVVERINGADVGVPGQYIYISGERYDAWVRTDTSGAFELFVPLRSGGKIAAYQVFPEFTCPSDQYCYVAPEPLAVSPTPRSGVAGAGLPGVAQVSIGTITATRCDDCRLTINVRVAGSTSASVRVRRSGKDWGTAFYNGGAQAYQRQITFDGDSLRVDATASAGGSIADPVSNRNVNVVDVAGLQRARATGEAVDLSLTLKPIRGYPTAVTGSFAQASGWSHTLSDGTAIQIPPGAVPLAAGDSPIISVVVQPTSDLPGGALYEAGNVYGYTISLSTTDKDRNPKQITAPLNIPAQLTMRYDEGLLREFLTAESRLLPARLVGEDWTVADNFSFDRVLNSFTVQTTTLGTWALMEPTQACSGCLHFPLIAR